MKKRLVVTGYGGFVAGSVVWHAEEDCWDLHTFSRRAPIRARAAHGNWDFDLRDSAKLTETFAAIRPDVVIHTAAIADIDYCERHRDEAENINVGVTRDLVRLCREAGARMILCSTDTVFNGGGGMYSKDDDPLPVNFYGETKVRAEQVVRDGIENSVVARLSLVFGFPVLGSGNSFLAKMLGALSKGEVVRVPESEVRTPIDVITVGRSLLDLAENDYTGTLHLAGSTRINRYEMARIIAERLGYSALLIVPTDPGAIADRAPRPVDVSLDNKRAREILKTPMRSLVEGLQLITESKENHLRGRPID